MEAESLSSPILKRLSLSSSWRDKKQLLSTGCIYQQQLGKEAINKDALFLHQFCHRELARSPPGRKYFTYSSRFAALGRLWVVAKSIWLLHFNLFCSYLLSATDSWDSLLLHSRAVILLVPNVFSVHWHQKKGKEMCILKNKTKQHCFNRIVFAHLVNTSSFNLQPCGSSYGSLTIWQQLWITVLLLCRLDAHVTGLAWNDFNIYST